MKSTQKIVTQKEWINARKKFLKVEKKFTKQRDQLNKQRRKLPWVKVDKDYFFEGPKGLVSLKDLFAGKNQLIVYHFMFAPEWKKGCVGCSFWADNFDINFSHLSQRDTSFVAISRASLKKINNFKKHMGWKFNWVSANKSDFNYDFYASFRKSDVRSKKAFFNFKLSNPETSDREGISTFYKDTRGNIFYTYSTFARGIDLINTTYNLLDLTAKGRDEDSAESHGWLNYHDMY